MRKEWSKKTVTFDSFEPVNISLGIEKATPD